MDSMEAFARGAAARARGAPSRVFDWEKAARLIAERKPTEAGAGLANDWEWTGGAIWRDGKPVPAGETYTYLMSNHAAPELEMDGERMDCWRWEKDAPDWDEKTYWPQSALDILAKPQAEEAT